MDTIEDNMANGLTDQEALKNLKGCIDAAVQRGLLTSSDSVVLLHESYKRVEYTITRMQQYREIDAKVIVDLRKQVNSLINEKEGQA